MSGILFLGYSRFLQPASALAAIVTTAVLATSAQTSMAQTKKPILRMEVQPPIAENAVRSSLDRAEQFLAQKHYQDAVDLLVRLIENSGNEMVPRSDAAGWIPLSTYSQHLLCRLAETSPDGLRIYRRQVDPLAAQWLEEGRRDMDSGPLRKIAGQLLASSTGDDALLLLGDMALQRGEIDLARQYWMGISPLLATPSQQRPAWLRAPPRAPLWEVVEELTSDQRWVELQTALKTQSGEDRLVILDTDIPLATVRARFVLASILNGQRQRAAAELTLLNRLHPQAAGQLAGKDGPLAERLEALLEASESWQKERSPRDWSMLGQTRSRAGSAPRNFEIGDVLWSCELEEASAPLERFFPDGRRPGEPNGVLAYHVSVSEGRVAVVEPQRVRVLDLRTGDPSFGRGDGEIWRAPDWQSSLTINPPVPHAGVATFDSCFVGPHLAVRTGPVVTSSVEPDDVKNSQLLIMDMRRQGRTLAGFPVECRPTDAGEGNAGWSFEHAAPLWDGSSVYALTRWNDGVRAVLYLDCYVAGTGARRWRTRLGGGRTLAQILQEPDDPPWKELTSNSLAQANDTLYACTNFGLICAVHATTGDLQWVTPYAREPEEFRTRKTYAAREAPPMVIDELVVVAPQDTGEVIALNRFTGRVAWLAPSELVGDAVHLLGADSRFVIISGDRLAWLDRRNGRVVCRFPEGGSGPGGGRAVRAAAAPRGCGRGLIAGDVILWPTPDRLFRFAVAPASPSTAGHWTPIGVGTPMNLRSRGLRGGNLVWSDDVLLIADTNRLTALATYPEPDPSNEE